MDRPAKRAQRMLAVLLSVVCALGVLSVSPAGAQQDCYPDGCTEPTNPPPDDPVTCELSVEIGDPGDRGTATVDNVEDGDTIRLVFGGREVARGTATDTDITLDFTVPDVPPGTYSVAAVGATFTANCAGFEVGGEVDPIDEPGEPGNPNNPGENPGQDPGDLGSESADRGGSGRTGPLPFTGVETLLLVAIALALMLIGWKLVSSAKRRRNAHLRRAAHLRM